MSHTRTSKNGQGFSGRISDTYNKLDSRIITREFTVSAQATGSQIDTGIKLASITQCIGAFVEVDTAEATGTTKTLNVGVFGGTAAAFISAANCASTGVVGAPVTTAQNTSTNDTIGYTFASADWADFKGTVHLTFIQAD